MITNGKLNNSILALQKLITVNLPTRKAYELRKFINNVDNALKAFNQTRHELIMKYGKFDENSQQYKINEDSIELFNKEILELSEIEVDIEIPEISKEDMDENSKIDSLSLIQLDYLIK